MGHAGRPELARRIETALLESGGGEVASHICFSALPVTGAWRYRDRWQITPAPPVAPRPEQVIGDQPCLLEVAYDSSSDHIVSGIRHGGLAREAGLVLHGLTGQIRLKSNRAAFAWVYEPSSGEGELTSAYRQLGYVAVGVQARLDAFSEGHRSLDLIDYAAYFARRGVGTDQLFELPQSMEPLLDLLDLLQRART
jgi:hypothetical protein